MRYISSCTFCLYTSVNYSIKFDSLWPTNHQINYLSRILHERASILRHTASHLIFYLFCWWLDYSRAYLDYHSNFPNYQWPTLCNWIKNTNLPTMTLALQIHVSIRHYASVCLCSTYADSVFHNENEMRACFQIETNHEKIFVRENWQ